MSLSMEIAVNFFFSNFTYTFRGDIFVQLFGGPIGARITMAVDKLVMQEWKEQYNKFSARIPEWPLCGRWQNLPAKAKMG